MLEDPKSADRADSNSLDRAQIIIVSGLLLAVTFVGLALVVNTAIFAENISTRDTGGENSEPLKTHAWVNESIARTIDRLNAKLTTNTFSNVNHSLEKAVNNQSTELEADSAERGVVLDLDRGDPQEGVRLRQTNTSRNFSDRNGNANWNLTTEVDESGQVTMQLERSDLAGATYDTTMAGIADSAFGLEFYQDDYTGSGDGTWRVYFFQGASTDNIYAIVEEPDQNFTNLGDGTILDHVVDGWLNQSCSTQGTTVTLRLSDQTFGGSHCDQFDFYGNIGDHTLGFTNAYSEDAFGTNQDRGTGTYDILVSGETHNSGVFHSAGNGQPFWQSAVYSQNVTINYGHDGSTYAVTNHTVVPKRHTPGGITWAFPRIERFDVTQTDNDPPTFDVDWNVSHPKGELNRVEVYLVDRTATTTVCIGDVIGGVCTLLTQTYDTNETVDSQTISVSGAAAGGVTTLSHGSGFDSINEYSVKLVVRDNQGRSRVATKDFTVNT